VSGQPLLSCYEAAAVMAMVTARVESTYELLGFTSGGGDGFTSMTTSNRYGYRSNVGVSQLKISPRQRLDDIVNYMSRLPMGGTDATLPIRWALANKIEIDAFVTYCVDEETEILTSSGWKTYDQVSKGEEVYTLNHETGGGEWQQATAVNVFPETAREMISMEGRSHSSLTTLDHRWPVRHKGSIERDGKWQVRWGRRWKTTESLNTVDFIQCAAQDSGLPTEPQWPDAFVELVAWAWTEGHWNVSNAMSLTQSAKVNAESCARIRVALTEMFGTKHEGSMYPHRFENKPLWVESGVNEQGCIHWYLNQAASVPLLEAITSPDKVVSLQWIRSLTLEQLKLFINISMHADGHVGKYRLAQKNKASADAFAFACILAGHPVSFCDINNDHSQMTEIGILQREQFSPIAHASNPDGRPFKVERVVHRGIVWCPTTPNGTWLARRNGKVYWTGNTDNESWAGPEHVDQALTEYRNKMGIPAKLIAVAFTADKYSVCNPDDPQQLNVVGFDTATPSVISDFVTH